MELTDSIDKLNGIGDKRKKLLKRVGVETVRDLLDYFPRYYEDRSVIHKIIGAKSLRFFICRLP